MSSYAMYYSYKTMGDVIIVIFDDKPATRSEKKGRVVVIYNNDDIVGYNIFNVKDIVKIKNEGIIYYPSRELLSVINSILINEGVQPLEEKEDSGYITAEVKSLKQINDEKTLVELDGNGILHAVIKNQTLSVGDKVVVAKVDTRLADGTLVKETNMDDVIINAHICTNLELGINEEESVLQLDKDVEVGKDFFTMEVR